MRKVIIVLLAVILLAAILAVGGILYLRGIKPNYSHGTSTAAVRAPTEIWLDSVGVAHVWAHSDEDLYFAQGYAHAQERLWQLEVFRRVAEGRLSEIFGESMLETDKFLRTIGIWQAAALNESLLSPAVRAWMDAYAAGVNHWIETHDGPLPPEFMALRIKPERWSVRHSLAVEKIMSWDLALYQNAATLTQSVRQLGTDKAKYLQPDDPTWGALIIELPELPALPPPAAMLLDALSITRASNAWVIGGARTKSGKPILANDMHLALRQPSIWYLMALHAPDLDVAGMTLPGVPYVIAGHTRAVAWGFTNAMMDDVDFFIERVSANDSTRYETPTGLQVFATRQETLHVKGRREPVGFTVRASRHGAIISDVDRRLRGGDVIAMQWAALDSSHSLHAFPRLNRARSAAELLAALPLFDNPHQNVVYADTIGNFGYQMAGRIPVRGGRKRPPILPVPGWTGEWDWTGYVPFGEHPSAQNPAHGYTVTANNRQTRTAIGDLISNDWELPFRALRIRELVLERPKHDAADVHRMQLDVKDLLAVRYQAAAAQAARAAGLDEVARQLAGWNAVAEGGSHAAAYFYAWYETLRRTAAHTLFETDGHNLPRSTLNTALDSGTLGWLGSRGKPALDSLSTAAMQTADSIARDKTWSELHYVLIAHAMGEVAAVRKLLMLNVGPAPHQGSSTTVNVAHYDAASFPFRTSYGPSERHVVDMADVDGVGGFILPSGQSGWPGGPHYADMFERWRAGGLWRIPLDRSAAEARTVHKTVIRPD